MKIKQKQSSIAYTDLENLIPSDYIFIVLPKRDVLSLTAELGWKSNTKIETNYKHFRFLILLQRSSTKVGETTFA